MSNKVISSAMIKKITKNGRDLSLRYATRTDTWTRPVLAESVKEGFSKAIEKADVPANAALAILAEKEHPSESDSKDYFTTVYQDDNGNHISTKHVYP